MKRIIFKESGQTINLDQVDADIPIFLVQNGIVKGLLLLIQQLHEEKKGWIIKTGGAGDYSRFGYHATRKLAIQEALSFYEGCEFYIDPEIKIKT